MEGNFRNHKNQLEMLTLLLFTRLIYLSKTLFVSISGVISLYWGGGGKGGGGRPSSGWGVGWGESSERHRNEGCSIKS